MRSTGSSGMAGLSYVLCTDSAVPLSKGSAIKDPSSLRWADIVRLVVIASQLATHNSSLLEVQLGKHTLLTRRLQLGCDTSACVSVFFEVCDGASEEEVELINGMRERACFQLFYLCHLLKSLYGGLLLDAISRVQEVMNERLDDPSFTGHHDTNIDNNNVDAQTLSALEESGALPALALFEDHFVNKFLTLSYVPGVSNDSPLVLDKSFGLFSSLMRLAMRHYDGALRRELDEIYGVYLFSTAPGGGALSCELQHTLGPPNCRLKEIVTTVASSSAEEIAVISCDDVCVVVQSYNAAGLAVVQAASLPLTLMTALQTVPLSAELEEAWQDAVRRIVAVFAAVSPLAAPSSLEQLPEIVEFFEVALSALNFKSL